MAELTPKERLQPSLLDRLTDEAPDKPKESREKRVLSPRKLRECVIRDLEWLMNTSNLDSAADLSQYPEVTNSVLNFGMPDLSGKNVSSLDVSTLEYSLRRAILRFEPRILPHTVKIRTLIDETETSHNAIHFDIEGELWGDPIPQQLYLKTEVDLETGDIQVSEASGPRD